MKLLLSGFEGSKRILHASSYLLHKYVALPAAAKHRFVDVEWLNYGAYDGQLDIGTFVKLRESQIDVRRWSSDIAEYLDSINDEFIVFTLDDYFLSLRLDWQKFDEILLEMQDRAQVVCGRLCISDFYTPQEILRSVGPEIIELSPLAEYSVTTQYCIWRRAFLSELMQVEHVDTPWEFEVFGSKYLNASGRTVIGHKSVPALRYNCSSALSSRWQGINISGCQRSDIEYLSMAGALKREELTNRGAPIQWSNPKAYAEAR